MVRNEPNRTQVTHLSSSLTSVKLKCSLRPGGMPPCKDTKLSPEEQTQQNKEILEQGEKDVAAYLDQRKFWRLLAAHPD